MYHKAWIFHIFPRLKAYGSIRPSTAIWGTEMVLQKLVYFEAFTYKEIHIFLKSAMNSIIDTKILCNSWLFYNWCLQLVYCQKNRKLPSMYLNLKILNILFSKLSYYATRSSLSARWATELLWQPPEEYICEIVEMLCVWNVSYCILLEIKFLPLLESICWMSTCDSSTSRLDFYLVAIAIT